MNALTLIEVSMSDNDRKLLIVLLVILVLLFILLGLIGMLIRYTMAQQAKRIDYYMHDPVVYHVIDNPSHFRKYGYVVNNRLFYHQALIPVLLGLVSLLLYIIYAAITNNWSEDFFGHFSTLLIVLDWNNPAYWTKFWGLTLLSSWPGVLSYPQPQATYWASYVLVPLWCTTIVYYLVVAQAFLARFFMINRRARTVYEKSLEGYNYYATMPMTPNGYPQQNPTVSPQSAPNPGASFPPNNNLPR